jgi:SAM-dependent methyltransferase
LRQKYGAAFEPGCSIGELTALLAQRCDYLLATDIAPSAVASARARCKVLPNVQIVCADLSEGIKEGPYDLIVFSEIGYYFSARELSEMVAHIHESLLPNGEFVAVHWLGRSCDHQLHGDEVHDILFDAPRLRFLRGSRFPEFRIDSWIRS